MFILTFGSRVITDVMPHPPPAKLRLFLGVKKRLHTCMVRFVLVNSNERVKQVKIP